MKTNRAARFVLLMVALAFGPSALLAHENHLIVGPDAAYPTIEAALNDAEPGATIEVQGGIYGAPLMVEKSVTLIGMDNPVIDGQGTGSLVIINAPDVHFEGFTLRNTGTNMDHEDTGIVILAPRVTVARNQIEDVLYGIYFAKADEGLAQQNTIRCLDRELGIRGDGFRVWYSADVRLDSNDVSTCRDVLIWYATNITIQNNSFRDSRYGLHFMNSAHATIENNLFEGNSVGSYLMYSQYLTITGNRMMWNRGPSGYGIALKDMDYLTVADNVLVGNRSGLFVDNSPSQYDINNTYTGNLIAYNDIGISALPSVSRNIFQNNTFLENAQQVSVLGRGNLLANTWQGNYWSDYVGYDSDGDGSGDMSYRAEKLFESLADNNPALRLFAYSPATQAIDFAASAFPSLRPDPKVIDEAPLMHYQIPASMTQTSSAISPAFLIVSWILVVLGNAICLYALRSRRKERRFQQQERVWA